MPKLKSVILKIIDNAVVANPEVSSHLHENTVIVYWPKDGSESHAIAVIEYEDDGFVTCRAVNREMELSKFRYNQHRAIKSAKMTIGDPQLAGKIGQWIIFLLENLKKPVEATDAETSTS